MLSSRARRWNKPSCSGGVCGRSAASAAWHAWPTSAIRPRQAADHRIGNCAGCSGQGPRGGRRQYVPSMPAGGADTQRAPRRVTAGNNGDRLGCRRTSGRWRDLQGMVAPGGWPVESAALSARPVVVANVHGRGTSQVLSLLRPSPVGLPVLLGLGCGKRADVLPRSARGARIHPRDHGPSVDRALGRMLLLSLD